MGDTREAETNNPETIQQRIDALLIAWQYAGGEEKQQIQDRIDALQIALDYAHTQ